MLSCELVVLERHDDAVDEHLLAAVEDVLKLTHEAVTKEMLDQLVLQLAAQFVEEAVGLNYVEVATMRLKLILPDLQVEHFAKSGRAACMCIKSLEPAKGLEVELAFVLINAVLHVH